jgi:hypothetical protein
MPNRRQPLRLNDFTGGINLRSDQFNLASNELADALNVEVDPRGGILSREGWRRWNGADVTADAWNPQNLFLFQRTFGSPNVMLVNNNKINVSTGGTFTELEIAATPVAVSADWHGATFANWGDTVYIGCGASDSTAAHKWSGTGDAVALTPISAGTEWNDDYTTPVQGVFPAAELVTTHLNYMFAANTREAGSNVRNRIRWSHPDQPEDWATDDYIDILNAGAIAAISSFHDHLLIFAELGIWALYGIDSDSWQLQLVTRAVSTQSPNWLAESDSGVYFFSWPHGVHYYDGTAITEVSASLRPAFDGPDFASTALESIHLGWMNRQLWFGAPYDVTTTATDAACVFVLDPTLGSGGSWTRHVGADGAGLGPFVEDRVSATPKFYGCSRTTPDVMRVAQFGTDVWTDNHGGVDAGFESLFTSNWINDGIDDHKKSWKPPTVIVREFDQAYTLRYEVMHEYDESNVQRQGQRLIDAGSDAIQYDSGATYDSGEKYGVRAKGSHAERFGTLGSTEAIQLRLMGEAGKPWGINSITNKFISRRYR